MTVVESHWQLRELLRALGQGLLQGRHLVCFTAGGRRGLLRGQHHRQAGEGGHRPDPRNHRDFHGRLLD